MQEISKAHVWVIYPLDHRLESAVMSVQYELFFGVSEVPGCISLRPAQ